MFILNQAKTGVVNADNISRLWIVKKPGPTDAVYITAFLNNQDIIHLAEYSSKERAREELDRLLEFNSAMCMLETQPPFAQIKLADFIQETFPDDHIECYHMRPDVKEESDD